MPREYRSDFHIIKDDRGYVLSRFGFGSDDPILFDCDPLGRSLSQRSGLTAVPVKIVEIADKEAPID